MFTNRSVILVLLAISLPNVVLADPKDCAKALLDLADYGTSRTAGFDISAKEVFGKSKAKLEIVKVKETDPMKIKAQARKASKEHLVSQNGEKVFARVYYWNNPIAKGQDILTFETRDFKTGKVLSSEDIQITTTAVAKKVASGAMQPVILGNRKFAILRDVDFERLERISKNPELSETADNNYLLMEVPDNHSIQPRVISLHLHVGRALKVENIQFSALTPTGQFFMTYTLNESGKSTIYARRGSLQPGAIMPTLGFSESSSKSILNLTNNLTPLVIADPGIPVFDSKRAKIVDFKSRTVYINDSGIAVIQDIFTKFGRSEVAHLDAVDLKTENFVMNNFKVLKSKVTGNLVGLVTSHDYMNRKVYTEFEITDRFSEIKSHTTYELSVEANLLSSHYIIEETDVLPRPQMDPLERLSK